MTFNDHTNANGSYLPEPRVVKLEGHAALEKKTSGISDQFRILGYTIFNKKGDSAYFSTSHPSILIPKLNEFENIYTSLRTIVEFIIDHLGNDFIYHQIFYNAISKEEKLIIGIFVNFSNWSDIKLIETSKFEYLDEYHKKMFKNVINLTLPHVNLKLIGTKIQLEPDISSSNMIELEISNYSLGLIKIKSITALKFTNDITPVENLFELDFNLEINKNEKSNISLEELCKKYFFNEEYFEVISNSNKEELTAYFRKKEHLKIRLKIEYKDNLYNVDYPLKHQFNLFKQNESELNTLTFINLNLLSGR